MSALQNLWSGEQIPIPKRAPYLILNKSWWTIAIVLILCLTEMEMKLA